MTPVPVPTKLQVSCIASILLLIEFAACTIADAAVKGGSDDAAFAAALVMFTCFAIPCFLPKLGLLRSRFHVICDWAIVLSWGVWVTIEVILSFQQSYNGQLVLWGIAFICWMMTVMLLIYEKFVAATPSSPHLIGNTHNRNPILLFKEPPSSGIWIVFFYFGLLLIFTLGVAFTDNNIAVATLSAVRSIILAMLLVSSGIAATTPIMVVQDEQEPLAPQEDTAATTNRDGDGNMA